MIRGIEPRHDRAVRGQRQRGGRRGLREEHAAAGEAVDRRRPRVGVAVAAQVVGARRVERDEDDVRLLDAAARPTAAQPLWRRRAGVVGRIAPAPATTRPTTALSASSVDRDATESGSDSAHRQISRPIYLPAWCRAVNHRLTPPPQSHMEDGSERARLRRVPATHRAPMAAYASHWSANVDTVRTEAVMRKHSDTRLFALVCCSLFSLVVCATSASRTSHPRREAHWNGRQRGCTSVMPGATVEISSPSLMAGTRSAVTSADGSYVFLNLPAGRYTVTASLAGFKTVVRENIEVSAPTPPSPWISSCRSARSSETVTVTAETPARRCQERDHRLADRPGAAPNFRRAGMLSTTSR